MKGIIVRDCSECLQSDIEVSDDGKDMSIRCEIKEKHAITMTEIEAGKNFPDWCPLDDLQEVVDVAYFDYGIKYRRGER